MATKKILITGSRDVGKTSLFDRFVHGTFSERPLSAVGLKVGKKEVVADGQPLTLILWEIKGEVSREKVPRTYFMGASAAVYVFDLSRPGSLKNMEADLALIRRALPGCLVRVVGNKKDLLSREELLVMERETRADCFTSARTGENVEALFREVGQELLKQ